MEKIILTRDNGKMPRYLELTDDQYRLLVFLFNRDYFRDDVDFSKVKYLPEFEKV